ncbi:MAG: hypothetical protein QW760_05255, partial [Thermofilaceae archaeon]
VDVEGTTINGGRDDPHRSELFAIDDVPHYSTSVEISLPFINGEFRFNHSPFNHFIDINKGPGIFDDFDGYSYLRGSASRGHYEKVPRFGIEGGRDAWVNFWFNDEYVHAPGQDWYRGCSPSISRYSFFYERGVYSSLEEESRARFPLADSIGIAIENYTIEFNAFRRKGVPYSVFMPVDNLARYWYEEFLRSGDWLALGPVMHAIQDASVPHHAAGYIGNWHDNYEGEGLSVRVEAWLNDASFRNEVRNLVNQWNRDDPNPPHTLTQNDWRRSPCKNWRIDHLVTWVALNAYHVYATVYNHFRNGYRFDENSARDLVMKATAMSTLVRIKALTEYRRLNTLPINLVDTAFLAEWYNDLRERLPFPGRDIDRRGFALIRSSALLEDGVQYNNVLETHPRWHDFYPRPRNQDGAIYGLYYLTMPENARFTARIGFLNGAHHTDGVIFEVEWMISSPPARYRLFNITKWYDGRLNNVSIDLRRFHGQRGILVLKVSAYRSSGQDWAVWVDPQITAQ